MAAELGVLNSDGSLGIRRSKKSQILNHQVADSRNDLLPNATAIGKSRFAPLIWLSRITRKKLFHGASHALGT